MRGEELGEPLAEASRRLRIATESGRRECGISRDRLAEEHERTEQDGEARVLAARFFVLLRVRDSLCVRRFGDCGPSVANHFRVEGTMAREDEPREKTT